VTPAAPALPNHNPDRTAALAIARAHGPYGGLNADYCTAFGIAAAQGQSARTLDQSLIAGLAQSIKTDGCSRTCSFALRARTTTAWFSAAPVLALQYLKKRGDIDESYQVPVEIKGGLDDSDAIRLATVENVQREQLHPMDEAKRLQNSFRRGNGRGDRDKTGLSVQTVKRRLALATLCSEAKKAFRAGTIKRAAAEAMTTGTKAQQRSILESFHPDYAPDPEEIRDMLIGSKPSVAMAVFPRERYIAASRPISRR